MGPVWLPENHDAALGRVRQLYNLLATITVKQARKIIREVPDQNGCEAYRRLVLKYGGRDEQGETGKLMTLLNFSFGQMDDKFENFCLMVKEHDDIPSSTNVPDGIKRAIVLAHCPGPLRTHLQLNAGNLWNSTT